MDEMTSKKLDSFIEKRVINGQISYYCKYKSCSFGCDSLKVTKNHISQHTIEVKVELENSIDSTDEENVVIPDVHINNNRFKCLCTECGLELNTESELKLHELSVHSNQICLNNVVINHKDKSPPNSGEFKLFTEYLNANNKRKIENMTIGSKVVNFKVIKTSLQLHLDQNSRTHSPVDQIVSNTSENGFKVTKISADYFNLLNKNKEERNNMKSVYKTNTTFNESFNSSDNSLAINSDDNNSWDSVSNNDKRNNFNNYMEFKVIDSKIWYFCKWFGCTFGTIDVRILKNHLKQHDINCFYDYICEWNDCNKRFKSKVTLERHQLVHCEVSIVEGLAVYKCLSIGCQYKAHVKYEIKAHIRDHIMANPRTFSCKVDNCGQKFSDKNDLFKHYSADHLGYGSKSYDKLIHNTDKPLVFNIPQSSQQFSEEGMHSSNRKSSVFKCNQSNCLYETNRKTLFDNHIQTHSKEKRFKCQFNNCNQSFVYRCDLYSHRINHRLDPIKK